MPKSGIRVIHRGHACSDSGTMANIRIETDERISLDDLLERIRVALAPSPPGGRTGDRIACELCGRFQDYGGNWDFHSSDVCVRDIVVCGPCESGAEPDELVELVEEVALAKPEGA